MKAANAKKWVLGGLMTLACSAWGDEATSRSMAALHPDSDGTIERLMVPRIEDPEQVYASYFQGSDTAAAQIYADSWRYHEMQAPYMNMSNAIYFQEAGVVRSAGQQAPLEKDTRRVFAQSVLRMRFDAYLHVVLRPAAEATRKTREKLKAVQNKIESLKDTEISVSKSAEAPKIHFGYNVFTDESKFEMSTSKWGVGVYHTRFVGALTNAPGLPPEAFAFRAGMQVEKLGGSTTLSYLPGLQCVQAAYSRKFTPRTSGTWTSTHPVGPNANPHLGFSLSYQLF